MCVVECDNSLGEFSLNMCFSDKSVIDFVVGEGFHCDGGKGKTMLAFQGKTVSLDWDEKRTEQREKSFMSFFFLMRNQRKHVNHGEKNGAITGP